MNNELNKHKTSDKVKWWFTLIAFLLMGITIGGLLLGYIKPVEKPVEEPTQQEQEANVYSGGYSTEFINTEGLSLFSRTAISKAVLLKSNPVEVLRGTPKPVFETRA